jgi:molybdopterin-binding protein
MNLLTELSCKKGYISIAKNIGVNMKVLHSNQTKLFTIILLMMVSFIIVKAQDKKEDPLKTKLDQIKGKIEKLTITVDGKDIVFEGKDAEKLAERLKGGMIHKRIRITDDEGGMSEIEGDDAMMFHMKDEGDNPGDVKKNVKVEINDGKKKVTVTTTKDGKDEIKVYEGEDADKFLKEEKSAKRIKVMVDDEDMPMLNHRRMMRMEGEDGCCCCCCRHRMPPPPMHEKRMRRMMMKEKDCKTMDKDCKDMDKDEDKDKK